MKGIDVFSEPVAGAVKGLVVQGPLLDHPKEDTSNHYRAISDAKTCVFGEVADDKM